MTDSSDSCAGKEHHCYHCRVGLVRAVGQCVSVVGGRWEGNTQKIRLLILFFVSGSPRMVLVRVRTVQSYGAVRI